MNVRCVVFWEVVLLGAANVVAIMKVNPVALVLVLMIVPIMLMGIHQMVLIHVVLLLTPNRNFLK
ncbi:hypothetical protein AE956_15420 [Bacteroides fragilis]|nr:hypothetical protein VU15_18245 [Bacteroides fragilis]ANQ61957.1 hypothetical protein AE940_14790 [Bacteroides fragilis]MBY2888787.1 hypothetical protein [Bacteroides fragilis]MBY2904025.1 hypothetical protein [Bacteroides fragilis]